LRTWTNIESPTYVHTQDTNNPKTVQICTYMVQHNVHIVEISFQPMFCIHTFLITLA
jgi:hypothetical protein